MKLTWFAGTTMRIHIGGAILLADAAGAPAEVDGRELLSGVDRRFALAVDDYALAEIDPAIWQPRRPARPLDVTDSTDFAVHVLRVGPDAVLVDAVGEPPLLLLCGEALPPVERWAGTAVTVLFGERHGLIALGTALLQRARPKLIALAAADAEIEATLVELGGRLGGTPLLALAPGLALEV